MVDILSHDVFLSRLLVDPSGDHVEPQPGPHPVVARGDALQLNWRLRSLSGNEAASGRFLGRSSKAIIVLFGDVALPVCFRFLLVILPVGLFCMLLLLAVVVYHDVRAAGVRLLVVACGHHGGLALGAAEGRTSNTCAYFAVFTSHLPPGGNSMNSVVQLARQVSRYLTVGRW